ncbi:MAG TPA: DUF4157 domain-containing protein [Microlunatus sp.]
MASVPVGPVGDSFEVDAEQMAHRVLHMPEPARASTPVRVSRPPGGPGGRPLSPDLRTFMEPRFGLDLSAVRVHAGSQAAQLNHELGAIAFTHRSDIYVSADAVAQDPRVMAHELTHVAQQNSRVSLIAGPGRDIVQRMLACPVRLNDSEPTPVGFTAYHGNPTVFHCGFRGILETRIPSPADPQNECFYDHSGAFVDESHPFAGCRGTPNQYDSDRNPISHTLRDTGGILAAGGPAFVTSRVHDISQAITQALVIMTTAGDVVRSLGDAFGRLVAVGLLTGVATADPGNWEFHGLPPRSVRHLNVMGAVLGSSAAAGSAQSLLQNLTRRLDSFSIRGLLDEITADANQALDARDPGGRRVTAAELGAMSLPQAVEALRVLGLLSYRRPPEEVARALLDAPPTANP